MIRLTLFNCGKAGELLGKVREATDLKQFLLGHQSDPCCFLSISSSNYLVRLIDERLDRYKTDLAEMGVIIEDLEEEEQQTDTQGG